MPKYNLPYIKRGLSPRFNFPYLVDPEQDELKRFRKYHINNSHLKG